jgi:gluconokinase
MNAGGGAAFCALIVMGVSGSGKSTIAVALGQRLGWIVEDADRFHAESNIDKMRAGIALTDDDRRPWLRAIMSRLKARGDHFMPQALLESQLATLEEPTEDERPIVVDIDASVDEIADRIVTMLDAGWILS